MIIIASDTCYSYTMGMSGLPDMYTRSMRAAGPRAEGVHIRQTTNTHGIIILMHHIAPPLENWNQLKQGSMQVCNPIVFIGKIFINGKLSVHLHLYVKDTHFDCGFWYHLCTPKGHNIIPQSYLTTLPIY